MTANLILIVSAFLHSTWNFLFKRLSPKSSALLLIVSVGTLFSLLAAPVKGGVHYGSLMGLCFTLVAGLFEAGYFHTLSKTYETAPFGISYSIMRGGAMLLVTIISISFLSEPVSETKLIGVLILIAGIFLAPSKDKDKLNRTGLVWALSSSMFIAGYHLFYGFALKEGVSQVSLFALSMLTSVPFLAFKSRAQALKEIKNIKASDYLTIIIAGVLSAGSFILFLYGLKNSFPGVAISLRNTSILFSQGFAIWLGEKMTVKQWLGILGIFIGALLIGQ